MHALRRLLPRRPGGLSAVVLGASLFGLGAHGCALSHLYAPEDEPPLTDAAAPDLGVPVDAGRDDAGLLDAGQPEAGPADLGPPVCPNDCDDGDACTTDRCGAHGCEHAPAPDVCAFFDAHFIRRVAGAHSVAPADLDGDGDIDIATSSHAGRLYAWEENVLGDGSVWEPHVVLTGDVARQLVVVDFDGDGDLDLVGGGGNEDPHPIRYFENVAGDASVFVTHTIGERELQDLDVADLDGDGDLDVVGVSQWDEAEVFVLRQGPDGFQTEVLANIGGYPQYVHVADLDLDGRMDILAAAFRLVWLQQLPNGTFVEHDLGVRSATSADLADVDGDGDLDLLAVADDDAVWVENLDGHFGSTVVHRIASDLNYAWSAHAADVDGDGDPDLLAASRQTSEFVLYINDGAHRWHRLQLSSGLPNAFDVRTADLDGDGDLDVLGAATTGSSTFHWWENLGRLR